MIQRGPCLIEPIKIIPKSVSDARPAVTARLPVAVDIPGNNPMRLQKRMKKKRNGGKLNGNAAR